MARNLVAPNATKLQIVARSEIKLEAVNKRIAAITASGAGNDVRAFFSTIARLARIAAECSKDIDSRFPELDLVEFEEALNGWYRVADRADAIVLCCRGESPTVAEGLITLRFLESLVR